MTYLSVDKDGLVNPEDVRRAITDRTVLISIMLVNNEIGVIQPVEEIGRIAKERVSSFTVMPLRVLEKYRWMFIQWA